jgi:hypothetical protein
VAKPTIRYGLSFVSLFVAFTMVSQSETTAEREDFVRNKDQRIQYIRQVITEKNYLVAANKINEYLELVPNDPDIKQLLADEVAADQADKEERNKATIAAEEKEKAEKLASSQQKTESNGQQNTMPQKLEDDPTSFGQCLGVLTSIRNKEGEANLTSDNMHYLGVHIQAVQLLEKLINGSKGCVQSGTPLESCIANYSPYEKSMVRGYAQGLGIYNGLRKSDPTKFGVFQLACSEVI